MTHDEIPKLEEQVRTLARVFGREVSPELLAGWWLSMKSFELVDVVGAVEELVQHSERMPAPVEAAHLIQKRARERAQKRQDALYETSAKLPVSTGHRPFTGPEKVAMVRDIEARMKKVGLPTRDRGMMIPLGLSLVVAIQDMPQCASKDGVPLA